MYLFRPWFITRFTDASAAAGTLGYGGNDFPVIRCADVILNISEAYLNLGDNINAIQYLDMVRARAGRDTQLCRAMLVICQNAQA